MIEIPVVGDPYHYRNNYVLFLLKQIHVVESFNTSFAFPGPGRIFLTVMCVETFCL